MQAMAGLTEQVAPGGVGGHSVDAQGGRVVGGGAGMSDGVVADAIASASNTPLSGKPASLPASDALGAMT